MRRSESWTCKSDEIVTMRVSQGHSVHTRPFLDIAIHQIAISVDFIHLVKHNYERMQVC